MECVKTFSDLPELGANDSGTYCRVGLGSVASLYFWTWDKRAEEGTWKWICHLDTLLYDKIKQTREEVSNE